MSQALRNLAFALIPIVVSLALTALLILLVGENPLSVASLVWDGAFGNLSSLAGVVNFWIPMTLAAMGLAVTFTAGLWNIGVEGQMMAGAIAATWLVRALPLPAALWPIAAIAAAALGGMAYALLVGLLKTKLGINEIFGGVALNALINVFSIYLISGPWQPAEGGSAQETERFPAEALLQPLSEQFAVSLFMLVVVIVAAILVIIALRGTKWGLRLKATGKNSPSALLLGVPVLPSLLSALAVCGALAGIAGAYRVLFTYQSLRPLVSGGIGFLALLVVLLAGMRALWLPFLAFAFSAILSGSTRLKIALQLDPSLAGVLQGLLVLSALFFQGIRQRYFPARDEGPN